VQIASLTAGILGLGINYGCYMSEVIRASILAVDSGQTEAALALGFGKYQALFRIVIPQALRNIIPSLGNYLVMMVKDTSLLAYVAVNELLLRTQTFASQTFLTIESYTFLAVAYLIISIPLSYLVKLAERRMKN
jgi:polar amino acid transport system permease protein